MRTHFAKLGMLRLWLPRLRRRLSLAQEMAANPPLVERAAKGMEDLDAGRYSLAGTVSSVSLRVDSYSWTGPDTHPDKYNTTH